MPEEPVVDKNTGHLYEKRLVHKYVQVINDSKVLHRFKDDPRRVLPVVSHTVGMQETGNSPITGESLSLDDLVQIKSDQASAHF